MFTDIPEESNKDEEYYKCKLYTLLDEAKYANVAKLIKKNHVSLNIVIEQLIDHLEKGHATVVKSEEELFVCQAKRGELAKAIASKDGQIADLCVEIGMYKERVKNYDEMVESGKNLTSRMNDMTVKTKIMENDLARLQKENSDHKNILKAYSYFELWETRIFPTWVLCAKMSRRLRWILGLTFELTVPLTNIKTKTQSDGYTISKVVDLIVSTFGESVQTHPVPLRTMSPKDWDTFLNQVITDEDSRKVLVTVLSTPCVDPPANDQSSNTPKKYVFCLTFDKDAAIDETIVLNLFSSYQSCVVDVVLHYDGRKFSGSAYVLLNSVTSTILTNIEKHLKTSPASLRKYEVKFANL